MVLSLSPLLTPGWICWCMLWIWIKSARHLSLSVCSPCSGVWRSHNWSGVWTHSVSRISRSIRQQPSLYLDYRGRYGQDHQVIRRRRKETIRVCGVAFLAWAYSVIQSYRKASVMDYVRNVLLHRYSSTNCSIALHLWMHSCCMGLVHLRLLRLCESLDAGRKGVLCLRHDYHLNGIKLFNNLTDLFSFLWFFFFLN